MVKVPTFTTCLLVAAITGATTATKINFVNKCATPVQLYHSEHFKTLEKLGDIAAGSSFGGDFSGQAHMFRHGFDTDATLAEFSMPNDGKAWFDISVIPPMPGRCRSFDDCKKVTGKRGFNVPMNIVPKTNANGRNCRTIACAGDDQASCADAYHFPDDVKTHDCPATTEFDVVFCPNGSGGSGGSSGGKPTQGPPQQQTTTPSVTQSNSNNKQNHNNNYTPPPAHNQNNNNQNNNNGIGFGLTDLSGIKQGTVAPTTADDVANEAQTTPSKASGALGTVRATYTYKGKQAGNVAGSYDRVTQLNGCVKQRVSLHSPVGPLSEEVSLVFRGPMDIHNIAVFDGSAGNSSFTRVSSYARDGGDNQNMVFMNNKNIDYSGQQRHGPQGFAGADGVAPATQSTKLKGFLSEATNPHAMGAGPGVQTGAEVNIMTSKKCDGQCVGYHGANDYHGWGGGRKIFITKVQMPHGAAPNQPAIWMLNAQVLHSNQYGCNCRGMGPVGGCGELDIAEVIETNANRDKVTTHYYFYDGKVLSPGGDNFASRPYDKPAAYATIIDDQHDDGIVKIMELSDWDFTSDEISPATYQQMLAA